MSKERFLLR